MLFLALNSFRNSCISKNHVCIRVLTRALSAKPPITPIQKTADGEIKRVKSKPIPKITLISNENVEITTLEEAQHISKRRDLKLVKLIDIDTKSQRPVYKLMTGSEYFKEEIKAKQKQKIDKQGDNTLKGEKLLMLNSQISKHDLEVNVKKIKKWISKRYEVRVAISSGDPASFEKCENAYQFLEDSLKNEARFLQKRNKGGDLKFQIIPPKQETTEKPL